MTDKVLELKRSPIYSKSTTPASCLVMKSAINCWRGTDKHYGKFALCDTGRVGYCRGRAVVWMTSYMILLTLRNGECRWGILVWKLQWRSRPQQAPRYSWCEPITPNTWHRHNGQHMRISSTSVINTELIISTSRVQLSLIDDEVTPKVDSAAWIWPLTGQRVSSMKHWASSDYVYGKHIYAASRGTLQTDTGKCRRDRPSSRSRQHA